MGRWHSRGSACGDSAECARPRELWPGEPTRFRLCASRYSYGGSGERRCLCARANNSAVRPAGLAFGKVFGERDQRVWCRENDPLTAAADDASLLPGAEKPADGVERGACHLRKVLARDGEVDLYAGVNAAA